MAEALMTVDDLKSLNRETLEAIIAQQQLQLATEQHSVLRFRLILFSDFPRPTV